MSQDHTLPNGLDRIRLEVFRSALVAAADEMSLALQRAAYSTNIKTRLDFSCAIFDRSARVIAQSFTQPVHLGTLVHFVPRVVEIYGRDRLRPGDGILCNDGHLGGLHLNDVCLLAPIYDGHELVAYTAALAHHVDVGGGTPGSIGLFQEIFQEGLIIPPTRVLVDGRVDENVFRLILSNIRAPHETGGDLRAQVAAVNIGGRRLREIIGSYGLSTFEHAVDELLDYTERRVRAEIATLPAGHYAAEGYLDNDGFSDEPIRIQVAIDLDADGARYDLSGSDAQRACSVNTTYAMTYSACAYTLRALIDPDLPMNDGFYRLLQVTAPSGTIVNSRRPAAIGAGSETGARVLETAFRALASGMAERLTADSKGCMCNIGFGGVSPRDGDYFVFYESTAGGYGARATRDGIEAVQPHMQNTENSPVEETEANYPVQILRYELIQDSEGAGRFRGGLGLRRDYMPEGAVRFSVLAERARFAPQGLCDGLAARPAHFVHNPDTAPQEFGSKLSVELQAGEVFSVQMAGGGGFGPVVERDPQRVLDDVLDGKISIERARTVYGVVIDIAPEQAERAQVTGATTYRLGVDVGGTFTDGVLIDEQSGAISIDKILTTPDDPSRAFLQVAIRLAHKLDLDHHQVRYIMHAMTTATNAVIERRGALAGLLVTAGFRDVLEIQRQVRHELYNLQTDKPPPLIRRRHCLEIVERLNYQGKVLVPLDLDSVARAVERLKSAGIDSIAVCFLHAYRNADHEQQAGEVIRRLHPQATVSLSSEIAPEIREYWRASTTVVNAYVAPVVAGYLGNVEQRLAQAGFSPEVHVMQSNGGVTTAAVARQRPIALIESGPAAGVRVAAFLAERMGFPDAISFDMGGTTAKMGLVRDGQPRVLQEFEVGAGSFSGTGLVKGSGYPILTAVVDLVEVGAGGGSLGWIDGGGLLRVGPRSAGAEPGPACYGRGGDEPTITDADLVLGRLNPDYFLGGQLRLDVDAARQALQSRCAEPLGIDSVGAAMGIVDIANATMGQAMRLVTVQRGYDPRGFCMVAFGGAGPAHANALAAALEIPVVLVPPGPGVAAALGMLVSDLRHDYRATHLRPLVGARAADLAAIFHNFAESAYATLAGEGVPAQRVRLERYLDMRYIGQSWKLSVPLSLDDLRDDAALMHIKSAFDQLHEATYSYSAPDDQAEIVNVGMLATGLMPRIELRAVPSGDRSPCAAHTGTRPVYFGEVSGFVPSEVYDRYALRVGNVIAGPAIVEEIDSTTVVHPGYEAEVAQFGVLMLRRVSSG